MSKLIILRGNSGSGKSTVANLIAEHVTSKLAVVDADYYCVAMLFPKPFDGNDLAALMQQDVLYCLEHDYNVIWDSIFYANEKNKEYLGKFLTKLHPADNFIFNFDVSFEETAKRHKQRHKSNDFTVEEMRGWYHPVETLGYDFEYQIPETNTLEKTVSFIQEIAQL